MKTTKMITAVLAVFLALTLFVGAGSAIDTIFVYEQTSGVAPFISGNTYYLSGDASQTVTFVTPVGAAGPMITGDNIKEGRYTDGTTAAAGNFILKYPTAQIDIVITGTTSSIIGGTVPSTSTIDVSAFTATTTPAIAGTDFGLVFTTPTGGKTTVFGENAAGAALDWGIAGNGWTFPTGVDISAEETGTWSVQAKFVTSAVVGKLATTTPQKYLDGKDVYSFTIAETKQAITVSKDTVIKGNNFLVTLSGVPGDVAVLTADVAGLFSIAGQPGVAPAARTDLSTVGGVTVTIPDSGKIAVEIQSTVEDTYLLSAAFTGSATSTKEKKVTVEGGEITIKADADSYYLGQDIKLSGTNTESKTVFIFIKGSNVLETQLTTATVNSDNTWSKTLTISGVNYDAGTYTIYAASTVTATGAMDKDSAYESIPVTLKQPFLTATAESSTVAQGDKIVITGTAEAATKLMYYVFGTNYYTSGNIKVDDDASYEAKIATTDLDAGQYFVVVQHPMYDGNFNVGPATELVAFSPAAGIFNWKPNTLMVMDTTADVPSRFGLVWTAGDSVTSGTATTIPAVYTVTGVLTPAGSPTAVGDAISVPIAGQTYTILFDTNARQSANAAEALCQALDTQNIDDIYVKLQFIVAKPYVTMTPVSDVTKGSALKVSGTTNVKAGETVTVDVLSTAFTAVDKTSVNSASFITLTTKVVKGADGVNTWEVTFDTTGLNVDSYTLQAIVSGQSATTTFKVLDAKPTSTATATATKTATATATATATPTKTPGFGAFLALAGLGAVAVLVLRRD